MKRGKLFAIVLVLILIMAAALPFTLSYIVSMATPLQNTFVPDPRALSEAAVTITAKKTVRNTGTQSIGPENFTFVLKDTATQEELHVMSDKSGLAVFMLNYNGLQAGRYSYTLSEANNGREGVTYSELVYQIDVIVLQDGDKLTTSVLLDGKETSHCVVPFENIYAAGTVVPPTGDETPLLLCAVLMIFSGAVLLVLMRKQRQNVKVKTIQ